RDRGGGPPGPVARPHARSARAAAGRAARRRVDRHDPPLAVRFLPLVPGPDLPAVRLCLSHRGVTPPGQARPRLLPPPHPPPRAARGPRRREDAPRRGVIGGPPRPLRALAG